MFVEVHLRVHNLTPYRALMQAAGSLDGERFSLLREFRALSQDSSLMAVTMCMGFLGESLPERSSVRFVGTFPMPSTGGPGLENFNRKLSRERDKGLSFSFVNNGEPLFTSEEESLFTAAKKSFWDRLPSGSWSLPESISNWVEQMNATVVYTDGSCCINSGVGAWAWFIDENRNNSGASITRTSMQAERRALLGALREVPGNLLVVTDCQAVWNTLPGPNTPLKARRQMAEIVELMADREVRFHPTKAHDLCRGNNAADHLALETRKEFQARLAAQGSLERLHEIHSRRKELSLLERSKAHSARAALMSSLGTPELLALLHHESAIQHSRRAQMLSLSTQSM